MNDTERAGVNELVNKLNIKEERIVDLEKENAKLEGKLADLTSEYYELENLKNNEIAELKAYNEKLLDGDIEKHNKIVELQNRNGELAGQVASLNRWFSEAKGIIKDLLIIYQQFNQTDTYIRAERFLKECE